MAERIPQNFLRSSEAAIASYNWTDIAEGTGIVEFFGYKETNNSGDSYHLAQNPLYSHDIEVIQSFTSGTWTKVIDLDFDLTEFNLPKIIKGKASFQIPFRVDDPDSAGTKSGYIIVRVRKWDGTTETEIASVQSETISVDNGTKYQLLTLSSEIPLTHFKKGETLRVTIEGWGRTSAEPFSGSIGVAFDPQNREGTYFTDANIDSRVFKCFIPFRIDL